MKAAWQAIERWLIGESLSAPGGGFDATIQPTWNVPPGVLILVVLAAAGAVAFVYWHESASAGRAAKMLLAGLRTALIAIVALMLLGWTVERHRTDLSDLIVMLDDSASMGIADGVEEASAAEEIKRRLAALSLESPERINLAKTLLLERDGALLDELARRYHLRFYLAGGSARVIGGDRGALAAQLNETEASEPASRLGNCVREVLEAQRGRPTAAIILLTDGATTAGRSLQDAAQYARRKSVPLLLVGLGSDRPPRDVWLADLLTEESAFVGDWLHFDVKLGAAGIQGDATVRLKRPGHEEPLAEEKVTLPADGSTQTVRLSHRSTVPGDFEYIVEVTPESGETNLENNRLEREVHVREETIRVLLVQAYPSYEFRFLKAMLLRELNQHQPAEAKSQGVRTVLQEADLGYVDTDKSAERAFPASREELFKYDVLIFGDVNPALLSPSIMHNIYEFVTVRGGGLIFVAGPRYTPLAYRDTPLAPLFPMNLDTVSLPDPARPLADSFRPRLTPLGLASPMLQLADSAAANSKLWREELAPLRWFVSVPDLRPGVRVLAEHDSQGDDRGAPLPIICLQFIGAGKVVFQATDETYRWRFRVGDLYFARYWVQTIRYLCRSKLLAGDRSAELTTDRTEYRRGDAVNVLVRFFDDRRAPADDGGVAVVVEREGGQRQNVTLHRHAVDRGIFTASAGQLTDGKYRVWISAPALGGQPAAAEFTVSAPPGELARQEMDSAELRAAAKLSQGKFYTFATAGQLLADLPRGRQVRIESLPPHPIWNAPLLAALFVVLIAAEWLLRKRVGML